jgi:hypothetical protein
VPHGARAGVADADSLDGEIVHARERVTCSEERQERSGGEQRSALHGASWGKPEASRAI